MWVASTDLPRSASHPFYQRLNRVLEDAGFDAFVEEQCAKFYADGVGRPSLAPGRYFRMLLLGYFEGLDSERAIVWRAADSLSVRQFLDVALHEAAPDHSTVSRTRRRIDVETHLAVFTWALQRRDGQPSLCRTRRAVDDMGVLDQGIHAGADAGRQKKRPACDPSRRTLSSLATVIRMRQPGEMSSSSACCCRSVSHCVESAFEASVKRVSSSVIPRPHSLVTRPPW